MLKAKITEMSNRKILPTIILSLILLSGNILGGCGQIFPDAANTSEKAKSESSLKGMKKLQAGDLKGAIEDYTQAIAENPKDFESYLNRGIAQAELGKNKEAIADYSQAMQLDADSSTAYYNRANAYHQLKQYPEAIKDYSNAIQLTPEYAYAYANRAASYFKAGRKEEAMRDLQQAIAIFERKSDTKNRDRLKQQLQKWQSAPN
jgi:tetratricopeptide (TPR) repeat protein